MLELVSCVEEEKCLICDADELKRGEGEGSVLKAMKASRVACELRCKREEIKVWSGGGLQIPRSESEVCVRWSSKLEAWKISCDVEFKCWRRV